jgi:hypothetical protein
MENYTFITTDFYAAEKLWNYTQFHMPEYRQENGLVGNNTFYIMLFDLPENGAERVRRYIKRNKLHIF